MEKHAFISGAAKRIGKAIALNLARNGWNISIHHNKSADDALSLKSELEEIGVRAALAPADLSNSDEIKVCFENAARKLGPINTLINNASVFDKDDLPSLTDTSFTNHMQTNLLAPVLLTQAFASQDNLDQLEDPTVINIIDQRVFNLRPGFMSYTLSKSALWTFTQTAAMELAPAIRVNAIGPGPTLPSKRQTPEQFKRQIEQVPLKRGASPEEISEGVQFLLKSRSITGEFLAMDGGQHLPYTIMTEEE
ncbi:SDR family oxidoreductase [Sneathiella limimaris]|uniref:SDR family oxidoreductase n=1 Tax=Sneathiella limimaris TaxID=1964213 RepID=UPI00146E5810|nr:SDR family oxidoreductase [Sneathiella limimaris]